MAGQFELMYGDCLTLMNDIPTGSVDMVLTDLPYGMTLTIGTPSFLLVRCGSNFTECQKLMQPLCCMVCNRLQVS